RYGDPIDIAEGKETVPTEADFAERFDGLLAEARRLIAAERFLHWQVAYPGVWSDWEAPGLTGGFDAVIGNPPWDRIKLQEVEWFATRDPAIARAPTAAARKAAIKQLRDQAAAQTPSVIPAEAGIQSGSPAHRADLDPGLRRGDGEASLEFPASPTMTTATLVAAYDAAKDRADTLGKLIRASGQYPLLGGGDINLYSLFVERAMGLVNPDGFVGLLTPSGIYADKTAAEFFKSVSTGGRVGGLFDFENRRPGTDLPPFFPDIDSRFKFCALIFGGAERTFDETKCGFFLHDTETIGNPDRCFPLSPEDFARVNPNTGTAPVFRTRRDAEITRGVYERHPVLVDRSSGDECRVWPVKYHTMFHMTNDSHLFRTAAQLEDEGCYPVQGNRWKRGAELYLPLYQGRMIHQFDHRANSVRVNPESTHNPYLSEEVSEAQHADPGFLPQSQYWVPGKDVESNLPETTGYTLGFRDIARPTDVRTVIASIVPRAGYGNTIPLLVDSSEGASAQLDEKSALDAAQLTLLVANLNTVCLDFVARQKAQGTHLNWYIVEQLPVIASDAYDRRFGDVTAADLVRDHVLRLTYTAHDMEPFARDLGYGGDPFIWDEEERRHLRARLDALYFHLYGLDRADAAYVLDTFPIVRREDESQFDGQYRTKDLILSYMNSLAAGDTEVIINL
ncbi:MAG: restriction endonuclease, partial [Chloroflexi bacterium]|nr:restriction endonuclease [Chloroflexota bacterium]